MSLTEYDLFKGKINKVDIAINRLKEFEPPEGYYLAFSGGKDSQCIYHLAIKAKVKFDAHFHLTNVDPPEVIEFTKKYYPYVEIKKPEKSMMYWVEHKLMPPTRLVRYCCEKMKENGGHNRTVITGVRRQESVKRRRRKLVETCFKDTTKHYVNPIIDWLDTDVWEFIEHEGLNYCKLYDKGYKRIGCIMCPIAGKDRMLLDSIRYPKICNYWLKAFGKMLSKRKEHDKYCNWETPEEVMEWWIYSQDNNFVDPDQTVMFE